MSNQINGATSPFDVSSAGTTTSSDSLRPFANLNLTEDQRTKIRSILQAAKTSGASQSDVQSQIAGVLTPAQQTTFAQDVQNAHHAGSGRHHHGGGHRPPVSGAPAPTAGPAADATSPTTTELDLGA